jgi:pimeloyl-ACP methyl ester carboxylesterase
VSINTGSPPTGRSDAVVNAPTKIARTAAGPVGYRELGTGSPILLIMGLGGSMDDWQPAFVAALAADHRVVVFDNAGVGQTGAVSSLGRTAVLGWSMGGMIAQALAVLHPAQVSRLVLAATQAGTGHALPVPAAAGAAAVSTDPNTVLSVLFPADQAAAERTYVIGILRYPDFYQAPRAVIADQAVAVQQWIAGKEAAGHQIGQLRVPTLVADGTVDQLDPVANDRLLAATVPGAKLILYPGAGHAFLFQDLFSFISAVQGFLG